MPTCARRNAPRRPSCSITQTRAEPSSRPSPSRTRKPTRSLSTHSATGKNTLTAARARLPSMCLRMGLSAKRRKIHRRDRWCRKRIVPMPPPRRNWRPEAMQFNLFSLPPTPAAGRRSPSRNNRAKDARLGAFAFKPGKHALAAHQRQQRLQFGTRLPRRQCQPKRMKEPPALGPGRRFNRRRPNRPGIIAPRLFWEGSSARSGDFGVLYDRLDVVRDDIPPELGITEHVEIAAYSHPEIFPASNAKSSEAVGDIGVVEHMQELAVEAFEIGNVEAARRHRNLGEVEFRGKFVARRQWFDRVRRSDERRMAEHGHRLEPFVAETLHRQGTQAFRQRMAIGADQ